MPLNERKKDHREISNCSKLIVVPIIEYKSFTGHKCFTISETFLKGKIEFSVDAVLSVTCQCLDFQMAFKMYCINSHNNQL